MRGEYSEGVRVGTPHKIEKKEGFFDASGDGVAHHSALMRVRNLHLAFRAKESAFSP